MTAPPLIRATWYLVSLWALHGIAREILKLVERRYSRRLALGTVVANSCSGGFIALFFANDRVINPVFAENISSMLKGDGAVSYPA